MVKINYTEPNQNKQYGLILNGCNFIKTIEFGYGSVYNRLNHLKQKHIYIYIYIGYMKSYLLYKLCFVNS